MEHLMAQRAALQVKKADFERRIKDLGSLPGDAFDKYRDAQPAELHKQLTRCNSQLKKYRQAGSQQHAIRSCWVALHLHDRSACSLQHVQPQQHIGVSSNVSCCLASWAVCTLA